MQKLINWYQDFSQEMLEVSQANRVKDFETNYKAEKREEMALRIMAYCFSGLFVYLLAVAILRTNLWTQ